MRTLPVRHIDEITAQITTVTVGVKSLTSQTGRWWISSANYNQL